MNGISFEGLTFNDLMEEIEDMEISEQKQKAALKRGAEIIRVKAEREAPKGNTEKLRKGIKAKVKKIDGDMSAIISTSSFYDFFTEFGTSKDRSNIGWWTRAINDKEEEAMKAMSEVIFK